MSRLAAAFVAIAIAAACGDKPAPRAPEPERAAAEEPAADLPAEEATPPAEEPTPTTDASGCPSPAALALAHVEADFAERGHSAADNGDTEASFDEVDEPPDLDGDAEPDVVLVQDSGANNVPHYFFATRGGDCRELVGVISATPLFGFYCTGKRTNGLCDLSVTRLMIHGETEHATWIFDGTRYEQTGPVKRSPREPTFP